MRVLLETSIVPAVPVFWNQVELLTIPPVGYVKSSLRMSPARAPTAAPARMDSTRNAFFIRVALGVYFSSRFFFRFGFPVKGNFRKMVLPVWFMLIGFQEKSC